MIALGSIGFGFSKYFDYTNPNLHGAWHDAEKKYILPILGNLYNWKFKEDLPDVSEFKIKPFESQVRYFSFNEKTGKNDREFLRKGESMNLPIEEYSEKNIIGHLAVEDPYFMYYESMDWKSSLRVHKGVDWISIVRAAYETYFNGSLQGGSTITLQLAKKLIPGHDIKKRESNISLKAKEILIAGTLEEKLGKTPILGGHINGYYAANGVTGQGASMKCYFGHSHPNLASLEQILTISASISNPNNLLSLDKPGVLIKIARGARLEELTESEMKDLVKWQAKYNNGVDKVYQVFNFITEEQRKKLRIEEGEAVDFLTRIGFIEFDFIHKDESAGSLDLILNRHIRSHNWVVGDDIISGTDLLQNHPGTVHVHTGINIEENLIAQRELLEFLYSQEYQRILKPIGVTKTQLLEKIHPVGAKISSDGWIRVYHGSRNLDSFDFLGFTPGKIENIINTGSAGKPLLMYFAQNIHGYSVDHKWLKNVAVVNDPKRGQLPRNHSARQTESLVSVRELLVGSWNRPTAWLYHTDARVREKFISALRSTGLKEFEKQDVNHYSLSLGIDIEAPLVIPGLYNALLTDGIFKYPRLVEIYVDGVRAEYEDERFNEMLEPKLIFPDKDSRKAILSCLDPVVRVFRGKSDDDKTIGKTGTYLNLEGSITAATSYLGQLESDSYKGVETYFVNIRKESSMNNSEIGISTSAARPAIERWMRVEYEHKKQGVYDSMIARWKQEAEDSDNALYESRVRTIFDGISEGKYGNFVRMHELIGAMDQVIKNYRYLISDKGDIRPEVIKEMLKTYESSLDKDRFIF